MPYVRYFHRRPPPAQPVRFVDHTQVERRRAGPHYIEISRYMAPDGHPVRVVQCLHCSERMADAAIYAHLITNHI